MEESDHDMLVGLKKDVCYLRKQLDYLREQFTNHLKHHWMLEAGIILALIGAIAAKIWG